jgi:predicted RNA binding protein YcfA (HicA-like mRNA interferase family)
MSQFPAITGKQLIAALSQIGFFVQRVKGSHHFLRHDDGRTTVIPVHAGDSWDQGFCAKS